MSFHFSGIIFSVILQLTNDFFMMMPSNTWSSNSSYILIFCHSFEKNHKLEGYLTDRNRKIKIKRCL